MAWKYTYLSCSIPLWSASIAEEMWKVVDAKIPSRTLQRAGEQSVAEVAAKCNDCHAKWRIQPNFDLLPCWGCQSDNVTLTQMRWGERK